LLVGSAAALAGLALWLEPGLILIFLLVNVWLIAGRADPGDLLHSYPIARWLSYLVIPGFTALVAVRVLARAGRWRLTGLEPFLVVLGVLTIVSGVVNHTGATAIVLSLAVYLRYPLLFLALYQLDLGAAPYLRFLRSLVLIAVALTIEAIVDLWLFGKHGDGTFFTTGVSFGHANAGLLLAYATCIVCAQAWSSRWRWYHGAYIGLVVVTAWIATVRSLFILVVCLPLAIWAVRYRLIGRRLLPLLAAVLLIAILGLAVALGPGSADPAQYTGVLGFAQLRLGSVRDVLAVLVSSGRELLGFGPRSFSPGSLGAAGEMYRLEVQRHGQYWVDNLTQSEFTSGFSELGLVGFAVYWAMLVAVLLAALRFRVDYLAREPDPRLRRRWTLITLAFAGIWLHYATLGLIYNDVWRIDATALIFWAVAAAIYCQRRDWRRQIQVTV
jgi:hypothetical protein